MAGIKCALYIVQESHQQHACNPSIPPDHYKLGKLEQRSNCSTCLNIKWNREDFIPPQFLLLPPELVHAFSMLPLHLDPRLLPANRSQPFMWDYNEDKPSMRQPLYRPQGLKKSSTRNGANLLTSTSSSIFITVGQSYLAEVRDGFLKVSHKCISCAPPKQSPRWCWVLF